MPTMRPVLLMLAILFVSGCVEPTSPELPTPEEQAREKLKLGLDAWVFGDAFLKFKNDHPDISFVDTDWGGGEVLLSYEIGQARTHNFKRKDGPDVYTTDFVVTIVQYTNSGSEVKKSKKFSVSSPRGESDQWSILGVRQ